MEEKVILIESNKKNKSKKATLVLSITFIVSFLLFVISVVLIHGQYKIYTDVQNAAIELCESVENSYDSTLPSLNNMTLNEKAKTLYEYFDVNFTFGNSAVTEAIDDYNKSIIELDESLADILNDIGYSGINDKSIYKISYYCKYTNFVSFYFYLICDADNYELYSVECLTILIALFDFLLIIEFSYLLHLYSIRKKKIIISREFVDCYNKNGKPKSFSISDLTSVELVKKYGIILKGNNIKYSLNNISNAEEIRAKLIELMETQKTNNSGTADELKKYKELLDSGAITQEEFDTKKKELLGL